MADKTIWAPWRSGFILGEKEKGCIFCRLLRQKKNTPANLVLHRDDHGFVLLNKYPYNCGHLLVVPNRHVGALERLTEEEATALMTLTQTAVRVMKQTLKPSAFNLGMNLGRPAGAGVPGHLHMHIVPRWVGDSNFMPIIGRTRVHSIPMEKIYQTLAEGFARL
ncbi:MAG: HIT domain-containing protein [candidate division Zixibacteria bacterium]|nr:HIT domain-containing protein [candidate division Zixibacteria bacterium]